jgi:ribonuclease HI
MIEVYTDGASIGNPGVSGAGIYIKANNQIYEYSIPLGQMSNHEAEFQAVIKALEICKQHFPEEILSFRTDSKVVVNVVEKNFTKNKTFHPLLEQIHATKRHFPLFFIKWIPDKDNINADRLAKEALHLQK